MNLIIVRRVVWAQCFCWVGGGGVARWLWIIDWLIACGCCALVQPLVVGGVGRVWCLVGGRGVHCWVLRDWLCGFSGGLHAVHLLWVGGVWCSFVV